MYTLVTGVAGFIGFHVARKLIERGENILGIDSVNNYYDPSLKESRLRILESESKNQHKGEYLFLKGDLSSKEDVDRCFKYDVSKVINLAAQAGVRKSLEDPQSYIDSNIVGFVNILEACRYNKVEHLTYASTSSVYGLNSDLPFKETRISDHPIQLYAATKRANELLAHSYSHLFKLPTTGLRFFTVYGPWGSPDMALFLFTKNILEGKPIDVFNQGNHSRDFTYIDDIVNGILLASDNIARENPNWDSKSPDPSSSNCPFRVMNIGNGDRVPLENYISAIEENVGKKAIKNYLPLQPGDVPDSLADLNKLRKETGYEPKVLYEEGIKRFVEWYLDYYQS